MMEKTLNRACKKHNLTGISVTHIPVCVHAATVYIHWAGENCVSGSGPTFVEALAAALMEKAGRPVMEEEAA